MLQQDIRVRNGFVFLFFFSSGFAALLYQLVWLKYLNLLFGSTTYATAAVLAAFMTGLSTGSWLAPRLPFLFRHPLRAYGQIEIGVGLFAMAFPAIYTSLTGPFSILFNIAGPESHLYMVIAFVVAAFVLVIPTSLMGASLPILSHYLIQNHEISQKNGLLYGLNTAGAVAGILVSAFVLIPSLGLHATLYFGVLINLSVGLICYLADRRLNASTPDFTPERVVFDRIVVLYSISGALAIGYEVLWTRLLVLHLGSSVYAYALMLSVFLLGVSFGSYLSGIFLQKKEQDLDRLFYVIQTLWSFAVLLQIVQFAYLSDVLYSFARIFSKLTPARHFAVLFAGVLQVLIVPTLLSGALFPIVVTKLTRSGASIRNAISMSYAYNTVGGIIGSLAAGFLFLPLFGTQNSLLLFAAANLILGFGAIAQKNLLAQPSKVGAPIIALIVFAGAALVLQKHYQILQNAGIFQMEGKEKLLTLKEDLSATISVETRQDMGEPYRSLSVNGVNVAGTSHALASIQKLQAHLPLLLASKPGRKDVLHIGFGSGGTAYSVSLYPETSITVVELSRGVVEASDRYLQEVNHGIVHSGKLQFIFFDGRSFLQNTRRKFDVILSDSIHPRYSGNGSLYTKEYYALVNSRLNSGGVHSQWIPLYSVSEKNLREILRAFIEIFPNTYVWYINSTMNPYIVVTGKTSLDPINMTALMNAWEINDVRNDLASVQVAGPYHLLDYFVFGRQQLGKYVQNVAPHIDDRLTVEYESSRILSATDSWLKNFRSLLALREPIAPYVTPSTLLNDSLYTHFYDATSLNLTGQLYFIAGKRNEGRRYFAQARVTNAADSDPVVPLPRTQER